MEASLMRARFPVVLCLLLLSTSLFAKDVYLSIGGKAGSFRTDARIINPSYDKDIVIQARYLPFGNVDNRGVAPKQITVAKRSQSVYDDVVQSMFGEGLPPLGAIRLTSEDNFIATQRIYSDQINGAQNGTLGQFVPGLEPSEALRKGVLIQLQSNGLPGAKGTFRGNWGGMNPNEAVANIKFKLYDRNNEVAGTNNLTLQPYGVFSPTNIISFFGDPNRDLTNAWVSFESDQPIFAYSSTIDNGSDDPTFITAYEDTGIEPVTPPPPPPPPQKIVTVVGSTFEFSVSPSAPLRAGDEVKFRLSTTGDRHGFHLAGPQGQALIDTDDINGDVAERIVTLPAPGTYTYFCTFSSCGVGHTFMNGTFNVAP
jgi:plastocyanin